MDITERIDLYLNEETLDEGISQWATKAVSLLNAAKNKSSGAFASLCKKHWKKLVGILQAHQLEKDALKIINKRLGTNFRNLDQISDSKIKKMSMAENTDVLNEDLAHWWRTIKDNAFPSLAIFAALQICFELDKLLEESKDFELERVILYASFWVFLITGHYIKSWNKWRKENPEEYAVEKGAKKKKEAKWRSNKLKTARAARVLR